MLQWKTIFTFLDSYRRIRALHPLYCSLTVGIIITQGTFLYMPFLYPSISEHSKSNKFAIKLCPPDISGEIKSRIIHLPQRFLEKTITNRPEMFNL
jgi:hypothetical protein